MESQLEAIKKFSVIYADGTPYKEELVEYSNRKSDAPLVEPRPKPGNPIIKTASGQHVHHLGKGRYEIDGTGEKVCSIDPAAP
jgi:hypothetical protein